MKARDLNKCQGIFPAFYACYDDAGEVSPARARAFTEYLIEKGVNGLYVGGSSGECIYHSVAERKALLEAVIAQAAGRVTIIAHVACNNTRDSMELAAHAESIGADRAVFEQCYDDSAALDQVLALDDIRRQRGILGQPIFDINGQVLAGLPDYAILQTALDSALQTSEN